MAQFLLKFLKHMFELCSQFTYPWLMNEFEKWSDEKTKINNKNGSFAFRAGEIWWCCLGKNVGVEINGKGLRFSMPVLVLKKNDKNSAIVIPLTSTLVSRSWSQGITIRGRKSCLLFSQVRCISSKRLCKKMTELSDGEFARIRDCFMDYIG